MTIIESITGSYVDIDGTRTFFDEIGEGVPFIGIHTAGSDSREYRYMLPEMAKRGYRAIALDLPGHGRTYPVGWEPTRSLHEHAEFVHNFAKKVLGEEKAVVAGCSIGGCISFDLAAHYSDSFKAIIPMEGLAWGAPILPHPGELAEPAWSTSWRPFLEYAAIESLGKPTLADPLKVKELWWQHQHAQVAGNGDIQGWASHDVRDELDQVQCPVLVIKGNDDFFLPAELVQQSADLIGEKAVVKMLDDIGHYPMFEAPRLIAQIIDDFVTENG